MSVFYDGTNCQYYYTVPEGDGTESAYRRIYPYYGTNPVYSKSSFIYHVHSIVIFVYKIDVFFISSQNDSL